MQKLSYNLELNDDGQLLSFVAKPKTKFSYKFLFMYFAKKIQNMRLFLVSSGTIAIRIESSRNTIIIILVM